MNDEDDFGHDPLGLTRMSSPRDVSKGDVAYEKGLGLRNGEDSLIGSRNAGIGSRRVAEEQGGIDSLLGLGTAEKDPFIKSRIVATDSLLKLRKVENEDSLLGNEGLGSGKVEKGSFNGPINVDVAIGSGKAKSKEDSLLQSGEAENGDSLIGLRKLGEDSFVGLKRKKDEADKVGEDSMLGSRKAEEGQVKSFLWSKGGNLQKNSVVHEGVNEDKDNEPEQDTKESLFPVNIKELSLIHIIEEEGLLNPVETKEDSVFPGDDAKDEFMIRAKEDSLFPDDVAKEDLLFPVDINEDALFDSKEDSLFPVDLDELEDDEEEDGVKVSAEEVARPLIEARLLDPYLASALPGESIQLSVPHLVFLPDNLPGKLVVTPYRVEFIPKPQALTWRSKSLFKIPVSAIQKITRKSSAPEDLLVHSRDARQTLWFRFESAHVASKAESLLRTLAFPISQGLGAHWIFGFAQTSKSNIASLLGAIPTNEPLLDEKRWRATTLNQDFSLSSTYPSTIYIPQTISDEKLKCIALFRSKGRIPALCWYDRKLPNRGGSIWRCSQPKVGFGASFSVDDETMIEAIRRCTASGSILIMDCRSAMAAMANKARGMGTEDASRYKGTRVQFENIANYHTVRSAFTLLTKAMNKHMPESLAEETFFVDIEQTGWLTHLRTILSASVRLAFEADRGIGCLVHCSDGWDRTCQVVSLAQLLVNGEARTIKGFVGLIHREWIMFGHQFRERTGLGIEDTSQETEARAPVFLQFLDCVWQLKNMFPSYFEFNEAFLVCFAHHSVSGRFVDFLGNSQREWECALANEPGGSSLWDMLLFDNRSESTFVDVERFDRATASMALLPKIPVVCRQVQLWPIYLKRCATPCLPEHAFMVPFSQGAQETWEWWM